MGIKKIEMNDNSNESVAILTGLKQSIGMIPNVYAVLGNSLDVLKAYLQYNKTLEGTSLSKVIQEKIALAVSGVNVCAYCKRAHFAVGKMLKESPEELKKNLIGDSNNQEHKLIVQLAAEIARTKGKVDSELLKKSIAQLGERGVVEVYGWVLSTIFTNFFNHLAETQVDFPEIV